MTSRRGVKAQDAEPAAKERILRTAERLFSEHGFDGTATKAVAEAAGVPTGLVFYYFPNKEALLEAVFAGDNVALAMEEALAGLPAEPEEASAAVVLRMLRWLDRHRTHALIFLRELTMGRGPAPRLRTFRERAMATVRGYLDEQVWAGRIGPLDTQVAAQAFGASVLTAALVDRPADREEFARGLAGVVGRRGARS